MLAADVTLFAVPKLYELNKVRFLSLFSSACWHCVAVVTLCQQ